MWTLCFSTSLAPAWRFCTPLMAGCKGPIHCNQCYGVCRLISPMICQSTTADFTCKKENKKNIFFIRQPYREVSRLSRNSPSRHIFRGNSREMWVKFWSAINPNALLVFHIDIFLVKNFEWSCTYTGGEKTGWFSRSQERKYIKIS